MNSSDLRMAQSWPSTTEATVGGWLVRSNGGTTRRANSALASTTTNLEATLDLVEAFYADQRTRSLVLVSDQCDQPGIIDALTNRGYEQEALTNVMAADATAALTAGGPPPEHMVRATDELTDEWFELFWSTRDQTATSPDAYRFTLTQPPIAVFATAHVQRVAVAAAQAVIWDNTAVLQCMVTRADFRRHGLAGAVLHGLTSACVARGVQRIELAVLADNDVAKHLYERAGFTVQHQYRYLGRTQPSQ